MKRLNACFKPPSFQKAFWAYNPGTGLHEVGISSGIVENIIIVRHHNQQQADVEADNVIKRLEKLAMIGRSV